MIIPIIQYGRFILRIIFCFFSILILSSVFLSNLYAQDKIYTSDNSVIQAKVIEVGSAEIKYKKFNNLNGPQYVIPLSDVKMIAYENGVKEAFNSSNTTSGKSNLANKSSADKVNGFANKSATISIQNQKARDLVLEENFAEAIAIYSQLISKDSANPTLYAEYAYALALYGIYDAALLRLDQSWSLGMNTVEVNYYTCQVFMLLGYDDIATMVWQSSDKYSEPIWISWKAASLIQKYKVKTPNPKYESSKELMEAFKEANRLSAQYSFFQSLVLFRRIIISCPDEYLPYIGYSVALEKAGALDQSAKALENALKIIGTSPENKASRDLLEQRLADVKQKQALLPIGTLPGMGIHPLSNLNMPRFMAFSGMSLSKSTKILSARVGYYMTNTFSSTFDLGVTNRSKVTYTNLGLSLYARQDYGVMGFGISSMMNGNNTTFYMKLSVGYSKLNKKKTSSIDIFVDVNKALKKDSYSTFSISLGKSIYFGKRK